MNEYLNADTKDIFLEDERTDEFLAHHGIQGMKWGVSNGPPYPLSSAEHNKVVQKAKDAAKATGQAVKKAGSATVKAAKKAKEKIDERRAEKEAKAREEKIRKTSAREAAMNPSQFTDEELARIGRRSQMQAQLKELSKGPIQKGMESTAQTLNKVGQKTLENVTNAAAITALERAFGMENSFGDTGSLKGFKEQMGENLSRSFSKGRGDKQSIIKTAAAEKVGNVFKDHSDDVINWDIPSQSDYSGYTWYEPNTSVLALPEPKK